jgi:hypothetical protein
VVQLFKDFLPYATDNRTSAGIACVGRKPLIVFEFSVHYVQNQRYSILTAFLRTEDTCRDRQLMEVFTTLDLITFSLRAHPTPTCSLGKNDEAFSLSRPATREGIVGMLEDLIKILFIFDLEVLIS